MAVLVVVALLAIVLAGVGWYFSNRILEPAPYQLFAEFEIAGVGEGRVRLPEPPDDPAQFARTRVQGTYGLLWRGDAPFEAGAGYGRLGPVVDEGDGGVVRPLEPVVGEPPRKGDPARIDITIFRRDPEADHGIPFERIELRSDVDLAGWWIDGARDTGVLLVHGRRRADLTETLRILPTLVERGHPVLAVAHRNHRFSDPAPDGRYRYGASEYRDVLAGVSFLRDQGVERIVIYAFSYGALLSFEALERWPDDAPALAAIVLDSPMLDTRTVIRRGAADLGLPLSDRLSDLALFVARLRTGVDFGSLDARSIAPGLATPVLVFAGTADSTIPIELVDDFVARVPAPVVYRRLDGVEHVESWNVDPDAYEADVRAFLAEHVDAADTASRP